MTPPEYWTEADGAELDVLVWAFVGAALEHRGRCLACRDQLGRWCPALQDAFRTLTDWRRGRLLASRAAWLRELRTEYEAADAAA